MQGISPHHVNLDSAKEKGNAVQHCIYPAVTDVTPNTCEHPQIKTQPQNPL